MVIPETGFDEVPINPTIRLDTVTKKNPNIMTRTPINSLFNIESPGICGSIAIKTTRAMLPNMTVLNERSSSVRFTAFFSSAVLLIEARLDLNEEIIVGMVLRRVINKLAPGRSLPVVFSL